MQSGPGRSLPLPGLFLPGVRIPKCVFVRCLCELRGPAVTGRGLGKCPPAPAVGRHLLLYFAQTPARPDEARLAVGRAQCSRQPFNDAPTNSERRAEALAYEVKEEVTANGRRRRTFVREGLRPAPRRMSPPQACLRLDSPRTDGPRRGRQGSGQMSPGVGRWPSPPPLLCPDPCPPRRGSACGGQGIEQAVSNKAPIDFERRAEALAYEVKGEVTANGRRRRTFVRKGLRPAPRRMNPPHACLRFDSPRIVPSFRFAAN